MGVSTSNSTSCIREHKARLWVLLSLTRCVQPRPRVWIQRCCPKVSYTHVTRNRTNTPCRSEELKA